MKKFHILTIFPEVIGPYATASILGRAQTKKLASIAAHDLREFSDNKHRKVDDAPYGGGAGMVMTVQPFDAAVKKIKAAAKKKTVRVILTAASGRRFTEADAHRLLAYDEVIFLCGRYEGVDHRVLEYIADEALSIGDYVLTGGELPALVMTDSIVRLIPGVLGNAETLSEESHDTEGFLEYPQYTKPEVYVMKQGKKNVELSVPPVLLSGNHALIKKWRAAEALTEVKNAEKKGA
ncbi:TPA: tRNA (guanosine(37)-N1)-methyltransferase TrmD [Candidatus Uhrbacteria bacterium]|nr:tRNA (guanosine(37)-N1)-methyltransferase TrmD [Candidatus Uhrbacteria bacterium]